jgi:hypothetical protein
MRSPAFEAWSIQLKSASIIDLLPFLLLRKPCFRTPYRLRLIFPDQSPGYPIDFIAEGIAVIQFGKGYDNHHITHILQLGMLAGIAGHLGIIAVNAGMHAIKINADAFMRIILWLVIEVWKGCSASGHTNRDRKSGSWTTGI